MSQSLLFSPFELRGVRFRNRVWVAPMAQYSADDDGVPTEWHLVHLGGMARGGAGLVMTEAAAIDPAGRLGGNDTGIWSNEQVEGWRRIARFIAASDAVPAIQLAHSGRKGSVRRRGTPLEPEDGGWETVAPSPIAYAGLPEPRELTGPEIADLVRGFAAGAARAVEAGFRVVEIHAAHGYLINEFLSPLGNHRTDDYGGSFENRCRFLLEIVSAVRAAIPDTVPLLVRISATDWAEGGWTLADTAALCCVLDGTGVDMMDISSGGMVAHQKITVGPGYQVPFARAARSASSLPVAAVGLITEAVQAEQILVDGAADVIMMGRQLLREPHWPYRAASELRSELRWPAAYAMARYRDSVP